MSVGLLWGVVAIMSYARNVQSSLPPYRLPGDVIPQHYTLKVWTDIDKFLFNGSVDIRVECKSSTDIVKLHVKSLEIDEEAVFLQKVGLEEKILPTKIEYDNENEFLIIKLGKNLESGSEYILHIEFKGKFSDGLTGYYKSKYVDNKTNTTKWLASTQFEPTYARRAFPCFDEPAMKANFTISLGHKPSLTAISNMPISSSRTEGDVVWDEFQESVPMSTYLVAYVVSDFEYLESDPEPNEIKFRVWARRDALGDLEFARKYGPKFLSYFENFFRVEYPLPKQDMVAIPDFSSGAMENWGLITYRESLLLVDNNKPSQVSMNYVADTIAHELAHQWFGNLVTMKWWTDLWLNEGFATYVASIAVRHQFPAWNSYNIETAGNFLRVFELDSLVSSHPVIPTTAEPNLIFQYFDSISYKKGSLLIHMMNSFLGKDVFRAGVSEYLKKLKYKNSVQDDLWASLTAAAKGKNVLPEGVTVKDVMDKWTLQTGYPVLTVKREGGTIKISQKRFLAIPPKSGEKVEGCWWVPLTFSTAKDPNFNNTKSSHWLNCDDSELTVNTGAGADDWIILNNRASGVYRVNYDSKSWQIIANTLHGPSTFDIDETNRMLLVADAMALAKAGMLNYTTAVQVLSYIQKEMSYIPWKAAFDALSDLENKLWRTDKYELFEKFIQTLLTQIYEEYSDLKTLPESYADVQLKTSVISWSCKYRVGHCADDAVKLFESWMTTGTNTIIKDLRSTVYCEGVKHGGEAEWNFAWEQLQATTNPSERTRLMRALSCTKQEHLLKRYLQDSLDESKGIKKQDADTVFYYVAINSKLGYEVASKFLYENIQQIYDFFSPDTENIGYIFGYILERMVYPKEIEDMKAFTTSKKKLLALSQLKVNQGLESAESNLAWMATFYPNIETALQIQNINHQQS